MPTSTKKLEAASTVVDVASSSQLVKKSKAGSKASSAAEPTFNGEAVSFGVSRNDANNDILSSRATSGDAPLPEILDMGMDTGKEEEISVANASAWFSLGASANKSNTTKTTANADTTLDKFKRLNEEKKVRERVDAEEAIRMKRKKEEDEVRKKKEAEERRANAEREKERKQREAEAAAEQKKVDELAERTRLREQAKQEREALTGDVDIHEQSNVMQGIEDDSDDDMDSMMNE